MKSNKIFVAAYCLAAALLFSACDEDAFGIRGEGEIVEEFRSVGDFDALSVAIPGNVYVSQGEKEEIRIEAQPNILENIEMKVKNGRLTIKFDRNVWNHKEIQVYLSTPQLKEVHVSGSGNVEGQNLIESESLAISVSGSGDVELEVDTRELETSVSGSGKIEYLGVADNHNIRISGSGDVEAFELESLQADVRISGSGKAKILVQDELDARVSGSGDIIYRGSPNVDTHISGSGKVRKD